MFLTSSPHTTLCAGLHRAVHQPLDNCKCLQIGTEINATNIDERPAIQPRILGFDHRRAFRHLEIGHLAQRNLRTGGRYQWQFLQFVDVVTRVTQVNRVTFQPFHRLGNIGSAHR